MPTVRTRIAAALALVALLTAAPLARADVVAVTLYPEAALVTEALTLPLKPAANLLAGVLTLPASAEPDTLSIFPDSASGLALAGVEVRPVRRTDEGRIQDVSAALDRERAKRQSLADALAAREAGAQFWRTQAGAPLEKTTEAAAMAAAVRDGLGAELTAASGLRRDLSAQDKVVADLEAELARLTGGAETVHEVTASFSGKATTGVSLRLTYRLRGAGWTPAYVLDARPGEGAVRFAWDAKVRQDSGSTWTNVALSLATAEYHTGANPPELSPWELNPLAPPMLMRQKSNEAVLMRAPMAEIDSAYAGAAAAPRIEGAVFDTYDAGRVTLASGDRKRLPIARESWKAAFDTLVRPYAEPRAYLRARATLDKAPRIPSGEADFLLEGALVQQLPFSLAQRDAELFFGADPQVAVRFQSKDRKSGDSGLFGGRNKHVWAWTVDVTNGKAAPIGVTVQDRLPRPGDERIKLEKDLGKGATETDGMAEWTFELAPGAGRTLEYGYELTWPGDMNLDLGGR